MIPLFFIYGMEMEDWMLIVSIESTYPQIGCRIGFNHYSLLL